MDTSTVRLVIFVGMFLAFACDYNALISTIFGTTPEGNVTDVATGHPKQPQDKIIISKKDVDENNAGLRRAKLIATIRTACLPKLICELTSSAHREQLSEIELSLLNLIRDTSLSTMAEVPSRYHFAAHMGQLISGVEGQGCHNFYPTCPLPGASVLSMMKKIRLR